MRAAFLAHVVTRAPTVWQCGRCSTSPRRVTIGSIPETVPLPHNRDSRFMGFGPPVREMATPAYDRAQDTLTEQWHAARDGKLYRGSSGSPRLRRTPT